MRSTLTLTIIIAVMVTAVAPVGASIWTDLFWGRHREYVDPGITFGIDEYLPKEWSSQANLMNRYHKETDKVFGGTMLSVGVIVTTKSMDNAEFAICVTDEKMIIGDYSGALRTDLRNRKDSIGGMRILGTFRGKYGKVELDTYRMEPGTRFLYAFVKKSGRYQNFSEKPMPLYIAPPLPEVIDSLKDASDETLKSWGLEALQTAEKVVGEVDRTPSKYDIVFQDGGRMQDVPIKGKARSGKILGVFSQTALEGIVRVESIDGNTIRSSTRSDFLSQLEGNEDELTVAWVVRVRKYADSSPRRQLDSEQMRNLDTYPTNMRSMMWEMATTTDGKIVKADGSVILADSVVHLRKPFARNTSGMYQLAYQVWTSQHEHWMTAPEEKEQYMPEAYIKYVRVIKLSGNGTIHGVIDEAKIRVSDRPGLLPSLAYVVGQFVGRSPINISNTATAKAPTTVDIDNVNNNSNSNALTNVNGNTINVGEGSATGNNQGSSDSNSIADP